jgi:hypothetical protein
MIEIRGTDIRHYILSSRSCNLTQNGVIIKPTIGQITFKFSNSTKRILKIKRMPGSDGTIIVDGVNYQLPPNRITDIEVGNIVKLIREKRTVGSIMVVGFDLEKEPDPQVVNITESWTSLSSRFKDVKGIELNNSGLFASSGAYISGISEIDNIETEPPNSFVKKDDVIKFTYPCRIIRIQKTSDPEDSDIYNRRIVYNNDLINKINKSNHANSNVFNIVTENELIKQEPVKILELNSLNVKHLKGVNIKQAGSFISLGRFGEVEIPLSVMKCHEDYVIAIKCQKISGNGKFNLSITTNGSNDQSRFSKVLIAPSSSQNLYVGFNSGTLPIQGQHYCLKISRPPGASTGEFLIKGVTLSEDRTGVYSNSNFLSYSSNSSSKSGSNNIIADWYVYDKNTNVKIKQMSEHFSILNPDIYEPTNFIRLVATFGLTDIKSRHWYNRMSPSFQKLDYCYDGIAYYGKMSSALNPNIVIASIDFLPKCSDVYIQEIPNNYVFNENQVILLRDYKRIITSSMRDYYKIKSQTNKDNIQILPLPWVYIHDNYEKKDHSIYFEENEQATKRLIESWDISFGKLYIVGSTVVTAGNIESISQYESYKDLLRLIVESKNLIYISENYDHKSGLIDLALQSNCNIITNNHEYIGRVSLIRNNLDDMPNVIDIKRSIKKDSEVKNFNGFDYHSYNDVITNIMKKIIGVIC